MKIVINKDTLISEILKKYPKTTTYFYKYGLSCFSCIFNQFESIEIGAKSHGMSESEIKKMIKEINIFLLKEYFKK